MRACVLFEQVLQRGLQRARVSFLRSLELAVYSVKYFTVDCTVQIAPFSFHSAPPLVLLTITTPCLCPCPFKRTAGCNVGASDNDWRLSCPELVCGEIEIGKIRRHRPPHGAADPWCRVGWLAPWLLAKRLHGRVGGDADHGR